MCCDTIMSFNSYQVREGGVNWSKEQHKIIWFLATNHRIDKRKSFVFARQYGNCFSWRINAPVPRNQPIKTAVGIVMHDFHGLKTMTFHHVADIVILLHAILFQTVFCFAFLRSYIFISDQKVKAISNGNRNCIYSFLWESQGSHIGSFVLCFTYPS